MLEERLRLLFWSFIWCWPRLFPKKWKCIFKGVISLSKHIPLFLLNTHFINFYCFKDGLGLDFIPFIINFPGIQLKFSFDNFISITFIAIPSFTYISIVILRIFLNHTSFRFKTSDLIVDNNWKYKLCFLFLIFNIRCLFFSAQLISFS